MKKLKEQMLKLNKDFKNEITRNILLNLAIILCSLLIVFLIKNLLILIYFAAFLILFNFYYYTRYSRLINKNNNNLINDFIDTFSYFRIYISNNRNVYISLKEISNYATSYVRGKLIELTNEIDEDKSLKPFLKFASYFNNKNVEEVMIAIYEMIDEGSNENYINQFIQTFTGFKIRILKTNEDKRLAKINFANSLSIVGIGILMVLIMLGIVSILGEIALWVKN